MPDPFAPPISLSAGGGGPSRADQSNGAAAYTWDIPFTFDHSGFQVSSHSSGTQSATSAAGPTMGAAGGVLGAIAGPGALKYALIGLGAWLILKH